MSENEDAARFFEALSETAELGRLFPQGFDFRVDPYDPVTADLSMFISEKSADDDLPSLMTSPEYAEILRRHVKRHMGIELRFALYKQLREHLEHASRKDEQPLIELAMSALEDANLEPGEIGVVMRLYEGHVLSTMINEAERRQKAKNQEFASLFAQLKENPDEELVEKIIGKGEAVLYSLSAFLEEEDELGDEVMDGLLKIMCRLPYSFSASLLFDCVFLCDFPAGDLAVLAQKQPLLPNIEEWAECMLQNPAGDFFERWYCLELLVKLKHPNAWKHLQSALTDPEHWQDECQLEDEEVATVFYEDVVEWLLKLHDRRTIPAIIQFLAEYDEERLPPAAKSVVEAHIKRSTWAREIQAAVKKYREGELVIVEAGRSAMDYFMAELSALADEIGEDDENGRLDELLARRRHLEEKWNNAYHADLNGLRPIDMPLPAIGQKLMQTMISEMKQTRPPGREATPEMMNEAFHEFQDRWMVTPRKEIHGQIPIVQMMVETRKMCRTPAQKGYYASSLARKVNELYVDATECIEDGDVELARLKAEAALALSPEHPFVKDLLERLEN